MSEKKPTVLEKLIPKKVIQEALAENEALKEDFERIFPDLFPSDNPGKEFKETMELHELLKVNVLTRLMEESEKLTKIKIKKSDLKQIVEYTIATMDNIDAGMILTVNYCSMCGICCRKPSPLSISADDYVRMTSLEPDLILDIEPDLERGDFKFIKDKPCKFLDERTNKCKIYNIRPSFCRTYPIADGGIVGAGDCEYMVRYVFEKSKKLLEKCLKA